MKEALFYEKINNLIYCKLCPHSCIIKCNEIGFCGVRKNIDGRLYSETYGKISSIAVDPIEKKPLYHFFPNNKILSVGSYGCNMRCLFCQNYQISQKTVETKFISPEDLVEMAVSISDFKNIGVAFTYNEPLINFEYLIDCTKLLKKSNLKTVIVSNGMINSKPLEILLEFCDAFNVDLKSFNSNFYKKHGGNIEAVKENIKKIASKCHIEITTLIIPDVNDCESEMCELFNWVSKISEKIPLHLSRFFPKNKMSNLEPTSIEKIYKLANIAKKFLKYVYVGNV
ncbi:MAG: AmmeMemoRadiSam system radical SAM enzyme [Firmicutes bacterium]|nr:AmmeMemoRadiSam system radical SAM enzyme [Bacillota bacterium]